MRHLFIVLAFSLSVAFLGSCKDQGNPVEGHAHDHAHHHGDHDHGSMHHGHDHAHGPAAGQAAQAGQAVAQADVKYVNVMCPVGDEKIKPASSHTVTVEHQGQTYALCCDQCIEPFKKDPEKYIAKLAAPSAANPASPATTQ